MGGFSHRVTLTLQATEDNEGRLQFLGESKEPNWTKCVAKLPGVQGLFITHGYGYALLNAVG